MSDDDKRVVDSQTPNTVPNLTSTPSISGNFSGNFCLEECDRMNDNKTVSCLLCAKDYHRACVNVKSTAANPAFTCHECSTMFVVIKTIAKDIALLNKNFDKQTKIFESKLVSLEDMNKKLSSENERLKEQVTSLTTLFQTSQWQTFRSDADKKELLLTDSVLSSVDVNKLVNTDIVTVSGAKIDTLCEELDKLPDAKYERILLAVGTNDISDAKGKDDTDDLIPKYTNLVDKAKSRSNCVSVSSVYPRLDKPEYQTKINTFNAQLEVMCTDNQCEFVNHKPIFTLEDGSINDGYLAGCKGPHLTKSGINKVAKSLKLRIKQNVSDVTRSHPGLKSTRIQRPNDKSPSNTRRYTPAKRQTRYDSYQQRQNENRKHSNDEVSYSSQACYYCNEDGHSMDTCRHNGPVICHLCGKQGHKQKHHSASQNNTWFSHEYDY